MTIEEMKNRKRELGYTNKDIAAKTGLPLSTVQKIFSGATSSPRAATIRALEGLLRPVPYNTADISRGYLLRETAPAYQSASAADSAVGKRCTLADYLALPDEQRVELIDGVFYDMASPNALHQSIAGFLHTRLLDFVLDQKGSCYPFISPLDVQLNSDDYTVVQPDVLVLCDRSKFKDGRIFGAPDLVIEVLSPSTKKKDTQLKLFKYGDAGVREYWIVDPQKKVVIQYDLEHMDPPAIYGFDTSIPVLIWGGRCRIDLREMTAAISFLWEIDGIHD